MSKVEGGKPKEFSLDITCGKASASECKADCNIVLDEAGEMINNSISTKGDSDIGDGHPKQSSTVDEDMLEVQRARERDTRLMKLNTDGRSITQIIGETEFEKDTATAEIKDDREGKTLELAEKRNKQISAKR